MYKKKEYFSNTIKSTSYNGERTTKTKQNKCAHGTVFYHPV